MRDQVQISYECKSYVLSSHPICTGNTWIRCSKFYFHLLQIYCKCTILSLFQIPLIHFFITDLDLVCSVDYSSCIITNLLHKTIYIPKITGLLTNCSVIFSPRCCWPHHQTCIAHLFDIFQFHSDCNSL